MEIPDDFKCPISLELMSDPVILSSGHTFDRPSIQRWLDAGHRTCPITKLPLPDPPSLIPNHALRSLISNFTPVKPLPYQDPQTLVSSLATSPLTSLEGLTRALKRDPALRRRLAESGAVSAVLRCVDSAEPGLREKALNLLLNLSLDDDNKVGLVAEGVIGHVVAVLRGPGAAQDGARAVGATILTSLAVVEVNKATIGAYPFAIRALISLLGRGNGRERKEAATALFTLCSYPENRRRIVEFGGVPVLMNAAGMGLERAVEVLGLLAKCEQGRVEMAKLGTCVTILVHFLKNGSPRGVQYALLTLASLCVYSAVLCREVLGKGVFEFCVGLLEDENEKVRRNASNLIQILRGKRSMS